MKVCTSCFNDIELKEFIKLNSLEKGRCDYCANEIDSEILGIEKLFFFFREFFEIFKEDSDGESLVEILNDDWNLFSRNTVAHAILLDILTSIDTSISTSEQTVSYTEEIIENVSYWEELKVKLKWESRFLTNTDPLFDLGWDSFFNKTSTFPSGEELYRARIHSEGGRQTFNLEEMGCPSKEKVTSGRANPQGIPYLYLSKTPETTLYETRAAYLDEISIGKFRIKDNQKIVLVDFTEDVSSFLNYENIIEYTKSVLLKKQISNDLSKPIRRYDSELEYIPTQFICEFIRYITGADGILFNSSLHEDGKNIVLFKEDKVRCISVKKHQVTKVSIESGWIPNY